MRKLVVASFIFFLTLSMICGLMIFRARQLGEVGRIEAQAKLPNYTPLPIDQDQVAKRLAKALTFATIASHKSPQSHDQAFKDFHHYLKTTFPLVFSKLEVKTFNPHSLLIKWPSKNNTLKPVLLMSHQDVVPIAPNTESQWEHPPFAGEISDDFIWGRGAMDDKCGVLGILEAAEYMLKNGQQPKRTFYFCFGDDEEIGGKGAAQMAQYCKEQGIVFEYVLDEGGAIVTDLFQGVSVPAALVAIAEKGYMDVTLSTKVDGGHSSRPGNKTAIGTISRAISRLENDQFPMSIGPVPQKMLETLATRMSFTNRLVLANLWLLSPVVKSRLAKNPSTMAMMRTTTAPTIFNAGNKENVLPARASANINFRIIPGETPASVLKRIKNVINDQNVRITQAELAVGPSKVSRTEGYGFNTIKMSIKTLLNNQVVVTPYMVVALTDSRHFLPITQDVYRFIGYTMDKTEIKRFHGTNERLSIKNYVQVINFYYLILNA